MVATEEIIDELLSVRQPATYQQTNILSIKAYYDPITSALPDTTSGYFYFCFLVSAQSQSNPTKIILLGATKDEFAPTDSGELEIYEAIETETDGIFTIGKKISSTIQTMVLVGTRLTINIEEGTRFEKDKKYIIKLKTKYQENNRIVGVGNYDTFTDGYWFDFLSTPETSEIQPNQIEEYRIGNMIWFQDQETTEQTDPIEEGETLNFKSIRFNGTNEPPKWGACGIELWGINWRDDKISYNEIVSLAGKGADDEAIEPQRVKIFLEQARAELVHQIKKDVFTDWDNLTEEGRNLINSITAYLSAIKIVNYEYEGYGSRFEAREVSGYLQEQADRLIELLKDKDTLKFAEDEK